MKSPFKFLDSFTKDDRDIFFGRDREIEELYQRVFNSKLLLVYGVSGTGKSSLIHCGLANKFLDTDWLPIVIRRGGNINESLSAGIRAASITAQQSKFASPGDFKKGVRSLYLDHYKPIFFLFDQFEELFIFGDKDERRAFIHIVKTLTESDLQCRMIFVMREEYMAWVTEFEKAIPTFFSNRVRIEKMSHVNALEAIKEPCKVFNISLEEGFAETLLEKLSPDETDVELTYLQVFLDKVFRLASENYPPSQGGKQGGLSFTMTHLTKAGNVSDLLGSFLDDQISLMEDPDTAMTVLKAFVSGKGTKRPANEQEVIDNIKSFGKDIPPEKVKELIQAFVKLRVLRDKDDNGRYELRHDALAEKVYEKFSTAEKELLEIRQFIENAYQSYLKRKILMNNDDLNYISNKDSLLNLSPDLQKFMEENRKYQKARLRTFRWLLVISAVAFIFLLATFGYTYLRKSRITNSSLIAKESITQFKQPIDRLCLALNAWNNYEGEDAKEALLKAFNNSIRNPGEDTNFVYLRREYLKDFKSVSSPILFAGCSEDNLYIYGYSTDSVFLWNNNGTMFSSFKPGPSPLVSLLMSSDGKYIGGVNIDSVLSVWDNKGDLKFTAKTSYSNFNTDQIFRFTSDNKVLIISDTMDAALLDINGKAIQTFKLHKENVNAVDISEDGKFIATGSSDSKINIWYLNSDRQLYDLYNVITVNTDTVRSIDFAPNGRYLVSASADGRVLVTSINGELRIEFNHNSTDSVEYALGNPVFSEFDESGTGITIKSYGSDKNNEKYSMAAIFVDFDYNSAKAGGINKFDYVGFSPDKEYLVYVLGKDISLISRISFMPAVKVIFTNYRLLQIDGQKPFFSPDGKYIYSVSGNRIENWFIDIETICREANGLYGRWVNNKY